MWILRPWQRWPERLRLYRGEWGRLQSRCYCEIRCRRHNHWKLKAAPLVLTDHYRRLNFPACFICPRRVLCCYLAGKAAVSLVLVCLVAGGPCDDRRSKSEPIELWPTATGAF